MLISKIERAKTSPSISVTVRQAGSPPPPSARSVRLAEEPWTRTRSPMRACNVGITNGWPWWAKPRCATSASSRMAAMVSGSYAAFLWALRTRTRSEGAAEVLRRGAREEDTAGRIGEQWPSVQSH